ncbi:CPBP family intramembrane glutamic endopeptidase [Christensenella hongkongensis]|uniref:CPBP family intramembrane glutamic endopeptidase n=1 Tax=Christensenella hongkongensis TaxID=270498 RepID=UPI002670E802|nr:CPBP family intramembrane glutamic endopeptidase [Christensenella hongkongensis]
MEKNRKPFLVMMAVYLICYAIRMVELMVWRTDQTLGEAFIQKLAGIVILILAMRYMGYKAKDIGFIRRGSLKGTIIGLAIGFGVFFVAYLVEYLMLSSQGRTPTLLFYVSAYALDGNIMGITTFATVAVCIVLNIVNVVMEEGLFRGLFTKLAEKRVSFVAANVIASLLFGLWHIALPVRSYVDGTMSGGGALAAGAFYALTSFLMGFQLGLLAKMTNGLWAPMAFHFVNNTVVNLLHLTTAQGADQLQFIRLTITQVISFAGVLIAYIRWTKRHKTVRRA